MRKKTKLVFGIGINNADYATNELIYINHNKKIVSICPFYVKWKSMLERCYSEKYRKRQPTYKNCQTIPEWHYFMTFRGWMQQQDWEGKHLDKDVLIPGNKIYSPDTCVFVSRNVNNFLTEHKNGNIDCPVGVYYRSDLDRFIAQCWDVKTGKQKYLGLFTDPEEAHQTWLKFKIEQAHILAAEQTDPRVAAALIDRYENYHIYFPQPR